MPSATEIKAEELNQGKNIAFIGTQFMNSNGIIEFIQGYPDKVERDKIVEIVRQGYEHIHHPFIIERTPQIENFTRVGSLFSMYAPEKRIDTLKAASRLGLTICGTSDWPMIAKFFRISP